ncbi:MAG: ATP-binding cassette domain-containing protein [Elusimicrobiota bacterium]
MPAIIADALRKTFKIPKRKPGLRAAIASFFHKETLAIEAVKGITLSIQDSEVVGFLGPNGAGKTTTLKMLSGLLYPTSGTLRTLGYVATDRDKDFLKSITLVMGNRSQLWWEIPVADSLLLNKEIYELSDSRYQENLDELVTLLEIGDVLAMAPKKLSLGQRMKAELAAALLHRPRLLLLDEPTLGLDVVMQNKIRKFLTDYNRRHGATILLTSHNMQDLTELCKRVIIIDHGSLIYDGLLKSLIESYAPQKRIRIDFAQAPTLAQCQGAGLTATRDGEAFVNAPRAQVPDVTSSLLGRSGKDLPAIIDISIDEPSAEDVIRTIFAQGNLRTRP